MKRFLLPLLAALALPKAVEANWFGRYGSYIEAKMACDEWERTSDSRLFVKVKMNLEGKMGSWWTRKCVYDSETRQFLGFEKKFIKDKIYTPYEYTKLPEIIKKRFRF